MSLRLQAEQDLSSILEDDVSGFGWPIIVTDPDGNVASIVGDVGDISQLIDPDTGQAVSGRLAHVTMRISSLTSSPVVGLPRAIADETKKPWLVSFEDVNGNLYTFKVSTGDPDRKLGIIVCLLELYE